MHNEGNIALFYNNYKWSIIFKNCELLYCTPIIDIILYINCISVREEKRKKIGLYLMNFKK